MDILIVHGYLLKGTGSNLYVNNLCRTFTELGYRVTLLCQEQEIEELDFVSRFEAFDPDNKTTSLVWEQSIPYPGETVVIRPDIGGTLPVYVYDRYEGYRVQEFTDMTEDEIEDYLHRNTRAIQSVLQRRQFDVIISNHTIMQPVYVARARAMVPLSHRGFHIAVIHGSALNFSVRKSPLLKGYAEEGILNLDRVVFVSEHTKQEFTDLFYGGILSSEKLTIIPAGVDTTNFTPALNEEDLDQRIERLGRSLMPYASNYPTNSCGPRSLTETKAYVKELEFTYQSDARELKSRFKRIRDRYDNWLPDGDAYDKLKTISWDQDPVIMYFGKYLWTKGVQALIAAIPLIKMRHPKAKFLFVGFGSARELLELMVYALESNHQMLYQQILERPGYFDPSGADHSADYFQGLLNKLSNPDFRAAYFNAVENEMFQSTIFTGIMKHSQLQDLLPCADISVAPSIFSEAFGLVAVEALSCGVIPLLTNHSGFRDIIHVYKNEFRDLDPGGQLKPLYVNDALVLNLAHNMNYLLEVYGQLSLEERNSVRKRAHGLAVDNFSWQAVAKSYLALTK